MNKIKTKYINEWMKLRSVLTKEWLNIRNEEMNQYMMCTCIFSGKNAN